ncbi:MAG TPA: hypothetical protein VNB67_03945, partial [Nitrososphaeraceae archaeon]|nr:hypothetical protein [Nitrososphaeraceae archaeon]
MINHKFADIIAHLKESNLHAQKLKMLLSLGLLTLILVSGVIVIAAYAQTASQQQKPSTANSKSTIVVKFDPKKGELPEGLVVDNKNIFVGWAPIGQVAKIDKGNLSVSKYGSWPAIPTSKGFMLGLDL